MRTHLCTILGTEYPIIQAPIAPYTSPELVAAVSNAGALGSIGSALGSIDNLKREVQKVRELTKHPFAINLQLTLSVKMHLGLQLRKQNQKSSLVLSVIQKT